MRILIIIFMTCFAMDWLAQEKNKPSLAKELEKTEAELAATYQKLRVKCKPTPRDDEWMVWGKMLRLLSVSLKPEALENLSVFESRMKNKGENPSAYTIPVRVFIKNHLHIDQESGVVVYDFQNNQKHSVLNKGDIIVSINDEYVITGKEFSALRKKYGPEKAKMTVLRLDTKTNKFKEVQLTSNVSDPLIGILDLMEYIDE